MSRKGRVVFPKNDVAEPVGWGPPAIQPERRLPGTPPAQIRTKPLTKKERGLGEEKKVPTNEPKITHIVEPNNPTITIHNLPIKDEPDTKVNGPGMRKISWGVKLSANGDCPPWLLATYARAYQKKKYEEIKAKVPGMPFSIEVNRVCDFCDKVIPKGSHFETLSNGDDKCYTCLHGTSSSKRAKTE